MNDMERDLAPRNVPAAWASSMANEVWLEIVHKRQAGEATRRRRFRWNRWLHRSWKAIVLTLWFWAACVWIYVEWIAR